MSTAGREPSDLLTRDSPQRAGGDVVDEATFDEFYTNTRAHLLRQLTMMTGDVEQAADVLQEAYARAWQRWGRVSTLGDPMAWVRTVAWRVAISQHRRSVVASDRLRRFFAPEAVVDRTPARDEVLDLRSALALLSPEHRRALVLYEMCGLSIAQVAAETGVAEGTVKSRLARARTALAAALGQDYLIGGGPLRAPEGRMA